LCKFFLKELFLLPPNYDPQSHRPLFIYPLRKAEMPKLVASNLDGVRSGPLGVSFCHIFGYEVLIPFFPALRKPTACDCSTQFKHGDDENVSNVVRNRNPNFSSFSLHISKFVWKIVLRLSIRYQVTASYRLAQDLLVFIRYYYMFRLSTSAIFRKGFGTQKEEKGRGHSPFTLVMCQCPI
jgi:hypothetical protein